MNPFLPTPVRTMADRRDSRRWASKASGGCWKAARWCAAAARWAARVANTLVRGGVGTVRIVDRDVVELSNLHRQVLFDEEDARGRTAQGDCRRRQAPRGQFATVAVEPIVADVDHANIERLMRGRRRDRRRHGQFRDPVSAERRGRPRGLPWVYGGCVGAEGRR